MYGVTRVWLTTKNNTAGVFVLCTSKERYAFFRRNWQLGELAHPVGDEASSIKAQKQGELRVRASKATMFQESRGRG